MEILLSKKQITIVDDDLFEELNQYNWYASETKGGFYAARRKTFSYRNNKIVYMHREILNCSSLVYEVDHINRNTLDNRKENLRLVLHIKNMQNRKENKNTTSIYRGVHWNKRSNKWTVQITSDGMTYCLGNFASEREAAHAYNIKAKELYGEHACLNEI